MAVTKVPADWSLVPTGLIGGDQFRLLFLSSTTRTATPSDIDTYNKFVKDRAAAGHADIRPYKTGFSVVGCTPAVDARDNTDTRYTNADKGVPIYWLGATRLPMTTRTSTMATGTMRPTTRTSPATTGPTPPRAPTTPSRAATTTAPRSSSLVHRTRSAGPTYA